MAGGAVRVIDPYTVEFNLAQPYGAFLTDSATFMGSIVSPSYVMAHWTKPTDPARGYIPGVTAEAAAPPACPTEILSLLMLTSYISSYTMYKIYQDRRRHERTIFRGRRTEGNGAVARRGEEASMQRPASSYSVDDSIRRVVDSLLRGDCRGKALCARCLVKLAMDHLDKSYTTREIGQMMDHVFSVPGPIMRLSTSPCVVCLGTTMPCLAVPAA